MNETAKLWLEDFLESRGVSSIDLCPAEDVLKEIEEVKGTISNERLWEKGYNGDEPNPHTENIMSLIEYLEILEEALPKEPQYNWEDRFYQGEACGSKITIGSMEISCTRNQRLYKDGTRQYMVYLRVFPADSKETITLTKVRGNLDDAKITAEKFLDKIKEDLCKN